MIEVFIITFGCVACTALLVFKGITITVHHTTKDLTMPAPQLVKKELTEEELNTIMDEQAKMPSYDDILKEVQKAIGGIGDE